MNAKLQFSTFAQCGVPNPNEATSALHVETSKPFVACGKYRKSVDRPILK
ncbi:MAG: hypothetical protein AMXMBFR16_13490 [Candidatus Uhrbacteria bacterium]